MYNPLSSVINCYFFHLSTPPLRLSPFSCTSSYSPFSLNTPTSPLVYFFFFLIFFPQVFYFLFGTRDHADCTTHDGNEDSSSAEECTEGAGSLTTIVKGHVRSRIVVEPTRENVALRCSRCLYHACVSFLANVSLSLSLSLFLPLLSSLSSYCLPKYAVFAYVSYGVTFTKSRAGDACSTTTPSSKREQRSAAPLRASRAENNKLGKIARPERERAFRDR